VGVDEETVLEVVEEMVLLEVELAVLEADEEELAVLEVDEEELVVLEADEEELAVLEADEEELLMGHEDPSRFKPAVQGIQ